MKQIIILSLILISRLVAQDYFPLEVGNTWTYCSNSDTTHAITYHVSDSINIRNKKYFLYENVQYNYHVDTIRKDTEGNIWKIIKGIDYLWFDFTKDNGAGYTFPSFDSLYAYEVNLYKYFTVQTCNGTYSHCIELSFDIPRYRDADILYSFAPQIGLIEIYGGESPTYLLYSASVNGYPLEAVNEGLPSYRFELMQNYPNPFNPITTIRYSIYTSGFVNIRIYDVLGRQIEILVNEEKKPGNYDIKYNAGKLPSGIYFCRMQAENFEETKKLILLK